MIQFTEEEVTHLQQKGKQQPDTVETLKRAVSQVMDVPILVPKAGIANWTHYYFCPKCSVELEFNRQDMEHHRCPVCGEMFSGEPYDSAWWGFINGRNHTAVFQMSLIYTVTGEEAYAQKAIAIMMEYSRYYKGYAIRGDIPYNGPGKVGAQTLDEACFQREMAMAYDLLESFMTQEHKDTIRDGLLLPPLNFLWNIVTVSCITMR